MEIWRLFWAKTNREKVENLPEDWTHPLWAHLIDVGSTAWLLWERYLPSSLKKIMVDSIGMNEQDTGRFLSIWIGLHDLGKAIPSFQMLDRNSKEKLEKVGLFFHEEPNRLHHGHASIAIVYRWLRAKGLQHDTLLDAAAACVGIHHGKICETEVWENVAQFKEENDKAALGDQQWRTAQQQLAEAVFTAWGASWPDVNQLPPIGLRNGGWPDWLMAFAGWTTLADWLGSMQTCFNTDVQHEDSLSDYLTESQEGAERAFRTAGLDQTAQLRALSFQQHFRFPPRPLQDIAINLPLSEDEPNLVIVEGPTGEGKTEGAFYLAARLREGVYVAMPSQATSDGLHPRLRRFIQGDPDQGLTAAHNGDTAALRLVHGNDLLREDAVSLLEVAKTTAAIDSDDDQVSRDRDAANQPLSWFIPKKKALLVPYGVGTADQLFLGVLHARHFFLRLFALSGKTVIFDEVHAYDAYMNTIFTRLLHWLKALHVNVVVLSATLPSETRNRMLDAWSNRPKKRRRPPSNPVEPAAYPVVWQSHGGQLTSYPFAPTPGREQRLTFQWCPDEPADVARQATEYIRQGATVMVICNTVVRAQKVFQLLDQNQLLPEADRMLLHARMPQAWRQQREKDALERFGENRSARPGLLVGTQVIEQSLDIDADVMITDLAPVDLLLQRAGRLHRHQRERPAGFEQPMLVIACSSVDSGELPEVDSISGNGKVYSRVLLWRTWSLLQQTGGWHLPLGSEALPGYRSLVEAVYAELSTVPSDLSEAAAASYREVYQKWENQTQSMHNDASRRLVPDTRRLRDLFAHREVELKDEEEMQGKEVAQHLQAATRSPDGINAEVLLLYPQSKGWSVTPDGPIALPRVGIKSLKPDQLRTLFGAAVRISHPGIVSTLWKEKNPEWQEQQEQLRVLKRFHLLELDKDSFATIGEKNIRLDERLGLVYD